MEEKGIQGRWKGRQLQDSIQVFADLVKKHYGKYPIIYSNESFYNKEMGAKFNRYYLFIANYNSRQPSIDGRGKCNIWQYSETGHLHGIWRKGRFKQIHEWYNHHRFDAIGIDDFIHISEYLIQSTYG